MKAELVKRLSNAHGYETQDFSELLYALAAEAVSENLGHYLQGLGGDVINHLFSELPTGGFKAQVDSMREDSGRQLNFCETSSSDADKTPESKLSNDALHRNYRAFEKLFPQVISSAYRYLRLESEGFMPLSLEWVYGSDISIMHTYTQNGDLMRDPDVLVRVDKEEKILQAVSFQQDCGPPIYQEVMDGNGHVFDPKGRKEINSFLTQWLSNIKGRDYTPIRAVILENGEDKDISFPKETMQTVEDEPPTKPESPLIHLSAADPVQFIEEVTGAHHGQLDVRMQAVTDELAEALSPKGIRRYLPQAVLEESVPLPADEPKAEEIIPYRWNAKNVKIAVASSQRRSSVTIDGLQSSLLAGGQGRGGLLH